MITRPPTSAPIGEASADPGATPASASRVRGSRSPGRAALRLVRSPLSSRLLRRALSGTFWSVVGQLASRALNVLGGILVARELGATGFGEYSLVLVTVGMFQNVAGLGLGTTTTRYLAGKCRSAPDLAGRVVALSRLVAAATGVTGMVAVTLAAPWLAREILGAPQIEGALRLGAVLLLFGPLYGAQLGVLTGLERFRLLAVVSVAASLVAVPMLVAGAAWGGATGGVVGLVASVAASNLLHALAVKRTLRDAGITARWHGALREWRILLAFSVPATLSNIVLGVVSWAAAAILARQEAGVREVGLFAAANQWRNGIVLIATAAGAALLPLFSDLHDRGEVRSLGRAFWASFAASAVACALSAGAVSLAAPLLMRAYGPEFAGAEMVLVLLAVTGALAAPLTVAGHAITGAGRMWLSLALRLVWAALLVSLAWGLRAHGALGNSIANAAAFFVHLALSTGVAALLLRQFRAEAGGPGRPRSR